MSKRNKGIDKVQNDSGHRGKDVKRELTAPAAKPVSLRPLSFEETVRGLVQLKPSADGQR